MKKLLIIFYKNPALGKVKTRLAATLGDAAALAIYIKLSSHTRQITKQLNADLVVYYSDFVDTEDHWENSRYGKALQNGNNLGDKMRNAFHESFKKNYKSICIIGTDCYELDTATIEHAFTVLNHHDVVVGPALDGGYYLLGMNSFHTQLFENKNWSTNTVAKDTINDLNRLNLTYISLPILRDVDTEEDLPLDWKELF